MTKHVIDIKAVVSLKLGFEAYFVLLCVYEKNNDLMMDYVSNCKKINTEIFNELTTQGYITISYLKNNPNIFLERISLTDKGKLIFESQNNHPIGCSSEQSMVKNFDDFRNNFPKSVKIGKVSRQLHTDLKRCKKLYNEIIDEGILHEDLCRCARLYIKEKVESQSEKYIQLLATWLHQRNYEAYIDEKEYSDQGEHSNLDRI